jgi:membrane protein required for colicin V production
MPVNLLDILFIVVLVSLSVRGVLRGFIAEILSKAAIILGIAAAVFFSGSLYRFLERYLGDAVWVQIIAFLLLFVVVFFLVKVLEGFLQKGMERLNLQQLDKFLGFFVGATEGFLLVAVILFLLKIQPFIDLDDLLAGSVFGRFFLPFLEPEGLGIEAPRALSDVR